MLCARWQAAIHSPVEVDVSLVDVELGRDSLSLRLHESILLVLGVHHVDRRAVAHSESIRTFMAYMRRNSFRYYVEIDFCGQILPKLI